MHFGNSTGHINVSFTEDEGGTEGCFPVLHIREMKFNKDETHRQGQNKAPEQENLFS